MLSHQDVEPDRGNGLDLQISQFDLPTSYSPKAKILVVDDTLANLKLLSDFLIQSGFDVMAAKSGKTALAVLENVVPDLIVLDVVMPGMDGFETCRYLKAWEKTKDIPVIFMTAVADSSQPMEKVKGLALGAVDYISKPIQLDEVLGRVKIHLHLRFLTKQLQEQNALLSQEIAEKNLIEKELRKSEERWQLALQGSNDGIWDHDLITNQLFLSPRCLDMLGYLDRELQHYEQWVKLIHPDDRPGMIGAIQSHLHRETPHYIAEYRMRCKDGTYKWMLSRGQAVWDSRGNPVRRVGSIADITERKVAEEALCQSLTTNRALLNAIPDLIYRCHADGTFLDCKPAKTIETLIPPSELIGKNVQEVLPPELAQTMLQAQARAIASGETQTIEYQLVRNGKVYNYEARLVAKDSDELIAIVRDISDRKQAEEALRQSEAGEREKAQQLKLALKKLQHTQAQLIQTEKMSSLGRMVGGVAHEINNPASFIAGNLTPAREYFQDLLELIELYQQTYPDSTPDIQAFVEEIDLEFLREDWSKLMDSM
ncbi:PAS domain S-box protein, partial [Allocoleopsis sp.]|uniref:PAS domain S-box protein n=1 Tax=Allocoleopsis sp. TaxID=3088169 RepID=UPI002FD759F2